MRRTLLLITLAAGFGAQAQDMCGTIAERCEKHIAAQYIPDGQFYRALLQGDELAEFNLTLFGGTTYRVAACSGDSDGLLLFNPLWTRMAMCYSPTRIRAMRLIGIWP
jgi:hypothetical protein